MKNDVVGKYWVDKFRVVPKPEDDDYVDRINEICSNDDIDVVIPQTTRETAKLPKPMKRSMPKLSSQARRRLIGRTTNMSS